MNYLCMRLMYAATFRTSTRVVNSVKLSQPFAARSHPVYFNIGVYATRITNVVHLY